MIQIKELDSDNVSQWDEYVLNSEGATFFHLSGWKRVVESVFGHQCHFFYAAEGGRIIGVLPLGHIKSLFFGNALISSPFGVYGGIVADNNDVRIALEDAACSLAKKLNVDYLELRNQKSQINDWPQKSLYVTFRKEIDHDPEKNMAAIPRKQRAMVRKGIKNGLVSVVDNNIDQFYTMYATSVRNLGTPVFSKKYFGELINTFGNNCQLLTIEHNGKAVSSVMSFFFRDQVLPYYGGGTIDARRLAANDFMYWELMRRAGENGIKIFDYGRSKLNVGSYSFKKNWGFEPEPLHYQYYLVKSTDIPDINPLNPKYKLFIGLWKRLPVSVSRVVGPMISCNLG